MVLKWKPKCFSSPLATVIVDTGGHFCRTEDGRTVINKLKYDKNYQEILQRNTRLTLSHDKYKQYPFQQIFWHYSRKKDKNSTTFFWQLLYWSKKISSYINNGGSGELLWGEHLHTLPGELCPRWRSVSVFKRERATSLTLSHSHTSRRCLHYHIIK